MICEECGNDDAAEGNRLCSDCLQTWHSWCPDYCVLCAPEED